MSEKNFIVEREIQDFRRREKAIEIEKQKLEADRLKRQDDLMSLLFKNEFEIFDYLAYDCGPYDEEPVEKKYFFSPTSGWNEIKEEFKDANFLISDPFSQGESMEECFDNFVKSLREDVDYFVMDINDTNHWVKEEDGFNPWMERDKLGELVTKKLKERIENEKDKIKD